MLNIFDGFFTEQECHDISAVVKQHQSQWYQCPYTGMYILGNSLLRKVTFIDNHIQYGDYFETDYFDSSAVELLKTKLGQWFDHIEFIPTFSRPGFQIIKLNENKNPSVWHYDDMLTCYPFEKYFKDFAGNFNEYFEQKLIFTILLSDGNYSFDYYPETLSLFGKDYKESKSISPVCEQHRNLVGDACPNPECKLKEFKTVFYKQGTMLVQNERFLHRVGLQDLNGSSDYRITLQSYGFIKDKKLYLVW